MEVQKHVDQMKIANQYLLDFLDNENATKEDNDNLIQKLKETNVLDENSEFKSFLRLISIISNNHKRYPNFLARIEQLIISIKEKLQKNFTNADLYNIFMKNKIILLILLENSIITVDEYITKSMLSEKFKDYCYFFFPEIESHIDLIDKYFLLNKMDEIDFKSEEFLKKRRLGENDSYICSLIRSDSVEEFIAYVNREQIPLSGIINHSIFETNPFLINNEKCSLIKYAAFFGSIEIFNYLRFNYVEMDDNLWFYAIHSNNAQLIHILEEINIHTNYKECLYESIKCHHNNIANYINDIYLDEKILGYQHYSSYVSSIVDSLNYNYFPDDVINILAFGGKNNDEFQIYQLCSDLPKITIPSSVTFIRDYAFSNCSFVKEIIIPKSVQLIKRYAFNDCTSLKEVIIPSTQKEIKAGTFKNCSSLSKIIIPPSITSIGFNSFNNCKSLIQIIIPSSVTNIGDGAFSRCSNLKELIIPSSDTKIGDNAFHGCTLLEKISIPDSITSIGNHVFDQCSSLKQISIPSCVKSIGKGAFSNCFSLLKIEIPSLVTVIEDETFSECHLLKEIIIPSSINSIVKKLLIPVVH